MAYIGKEPLAGNFVKLDAITTSATATYALTRSSVAFKPANAESLLVSLNGVTQAPLDAYTVNGTNIVFASALTSSDTIDYILALGEIGAVTTPADSTVDTPKLTTGAVTAAKLATDSVTTIKIADDAVTGAKIENNPTIAGNLTVSGNMVGTLTTVAQPNITSVGTLTGLTVSGNIGGTLTTAAQPNITSVGALNGGSITSGFGAIDVGSSDIATTGSGSFGNINATTIANMSFNSQGSYLGNYRAIGWGGTSNGNTHIYSQYNTVDDLVLHAGTGKDIVFETGGSSADRLRLDSDGNLGLGINANFTTGAGFQLADNYKIGFGAGGNSRPDFQLGYNSSTGELELACGNGADTADMSIPPGQAQIKFFSPSSNRTALYFLDQDNSNYAVSGYEAAQYNGGTNKWYTVNSTNFAIATGGSTGLFMKHDTRQTTLSYGGQNYPGDTSKILTLGYSLGNNKGGLYMPTYSYYSDVCFRVVNNDTNNGRQHDDFLFERNGSRHGGIRIIGNSGTSYQSISDYREKTDEKTIDDAIGTVKKLKPYNFKWKKSGIRQDGFFAHEVDEVLDYAVSGDKDAIKTYEGVVLNKDGNMIASGIKKEDFDKRLDDGEDEEASPIGETTYPEGSTWKATHEDIEPQQMDVAKLVPILTAALQEAIKRIEILESK